MHNYHKKLQFSSNVPNRKQYQSMLKLQNYLHININIVKVFIATPNSGGCIPRNIQRPCIFSSELFNRNFSNQQHKNKACYTRMLQELTLCGGNFYNVLIGGIFCELFTQHCYVLVNTKNKGLAIAPYFTQFLDY